MTIAISTRSALPKAVLLVAEHSPPRIDTLPLRDLSRPWQSHAGVFASRIEFSRTVFGKDVYSRWSGRTNAFHWPSLARVGVEASRLSAEQSTGDAYTGLSSPMRYLWDDRASRNVWRFAGPGAGKNDSLFFARHSR